jgi:uncharacterized membrane protein YraQ (UPF0718 family)
VGYVTVPRLRHSHGQANRLFVYDCCPKVLLLLTAVVFVTGVLREVVQPEKTRAILANSILADRRLSVNSTSGIVFTPFCSCSSYRFIGFVSAGIPLGVCFSFLIAGPMVGPVGLELLYGLVG